MEEMTHIFIVVVEHFTKLLARYVCVIEDLVIRAFSVKILMYAVTENQKMNRRNAG